MPFPGTSVPGTSVAGTSRLGHGCLRRSRRRKTGELPGVGGGGLARGGAGRRRGSGGCGRTGCGPRGFRASGRPDGADGREEASAMPARGSRLLRALAEAPKAPASLDDGAEWGASGEAARPGAPRVFAAEGCPRALLRRLLAGAADDAGALTALGIEREILTLCRERQEVVAGLFETEARLRELRTPPPDPAATAVQTPNPLPDVRESAASRPASVSPLRLALSGPARQANETDPGAEDPGAEDARSGDTRARRRSPGRGAASALCVVLDHRHGGRAPRRHHRRERRVVRARGRSAARRGHRRRDRRAPARGPHPGRRGDGRSDGRCRTPARVSMARVSVRGREADGEGDRAPARSVGRGPARRRGAAGRSLGPPARERRRTVRMAGRGG